MVGVTVGILRPPQHNMPTNLKLGCSKIRQNLPDVAYRAKPLGISLCDGSDMPIVVPTIVQMATVRELEVESYQNPPDLKNKFLHQWMCDSMECHFQTVDF
jgi:hypothetical protein